MTDAVPYPRLRGQLAEVLRSVAHRCQHDPCSTCLILSDEDFDTQIEATAMHDGKATRIEGAPDAIADALMPLIAAEVQGHTQAATEALRRVEALADELCDRFAPTRNPRYYADRIRHALTADAEHHGTAR
jgi:hypothetical protein